jgi:FKBP-type peptidyl-prolyl cis-trans isomerase
MRGFKDAVSGNLLLTEAELNQAMAEMQSRMTARQAELSGDSAAMQRVTDAFMRNALPEAEAALAELQRNAKETKEKQPAGSVEARDTASLTNDAAVQTAPALRDRKGQLSYAFGATYANALRAQKLGLDLDFVLEGLGDAVSRNSRMNGAELRSAINTLRMRAKTSLAEANGRQGEAFLTENATKAGVVTLESSLQYRILKAGQGKKPTIDDTVVCHYRGTLPDGTEFDSSYRRNQPSAFVVERAMMGLREALQLMPVGSKWQLFIPGHLANGLTRSGVGPNSTVIFEVELISIQGES